ncbi:MAG: M16 family metallopeptidase [Dermatophilaceae bacterium]|nr:insulinase family protein [Intrasporangiaceae bacterium]
MTDQALPASGDVDPTSIPRPSVTPPAPWAFPHPTSDWTLDNGLRVLAYDVPGQYVISASLVVPLPLSTEPREVEGVASLMSQLLDEGTAQHSSEEFAGLLERHGIALSATVNDGALLVDLDVPVRHLTMAFRLMTEALAEPAFPEDEVRRLRTARLAEIEQERASAPHRASRELIGTLWAPYERAARPTAGAASTVATITPDHVRAFHAERVGPEGAGLVLAGALAGVNVRALVEATMGEWRAPSHTPPAAAVAPDLAVDAARVVLVDRPGSVQSEITIGWRGPDRHVEGGWAPYPVIGFLLGGSPNARIDAVLREDKGYTYGMRTGVRPRRAGGLLLTSGSVRADATVDSLRILADLLDPAQVAFTEDELRSGVDFIAGTAPGRYATADSIASEASSLLMDRLPLDFTTTTRTDTLALSVEDLTAAYAGLAPGQWCIVVVGDASEYADRVRELGIGDVSVVAN